MTLPPGVDKSKVNSLMPCWIALASEFINNVVVWSFTLAVNERYSLVECGGDGGVPMGKNSISKMLVS